MTIRYIASSHPASHRRVAIGCHPRQKVNPFRVQCVVHLYINPVIFGFAVCVYYYYLYISYSQWYNILCTYAQLYENNVIYLFIYSICIVYYS